jgi:nucleoid DNA-binding protein
MSFAELVASVAKDSGVSERKVARVLRSFTRVTAAAIGRGLKVTLPRFGIFLPRDIEERSIFNGKRKMQSRRALKFRQSRTLR